MTDDQPRGGWSLWIKLVLALITLSVLLLIMCASEIIELGIKILMEKPYGVKIK
jgi:hypothetical protein